jgi:hypothetical protein
MLAAPDMEAIRPGTAVAICNAPKNEAWVKIFAKPRYPPPSPTFRFFKKKIIFLPFRASHI